MRVFIPLESPPIPTIIRVPADKARYLITVMRLKQGDSFEVIDGTGNVYDAKAAVITRRDLQAELISRRPSSPQTSRRLILCQSLLKGPKIDIVVQKTTELGIAEIYPVVTERSVPRETSKTVRWQKIAEEASEQSGRSTIPVIHGPRSYASFLGEREGMIRGRGLFLSTCGGISLREGIRKVVQGEGITVSDDEEGICLIVGPEGGFTAEEEETSRRYGLITVSMGDLVLRAETAAVAAVAILQYLLGEDGT